MPKKLMPLNYAILKLFEDGREHYAEDVISDLKRDYGRYKLLTKKCVDETLATAKENGLLDEVDAQIVNGCELRIIFKISDYGKKMIERYL